MLKLKQIRDEQKMSIPKLADASGIPIRTIENIERRGDCKASTAYKLSKALGITLDDLWSDEVGE